MLKLNLSTRPFYNDRLVTVVLALVAVVAIGLAAVDAQQLWSLSARRSALTTAVSRDEAAARRANADAVTIERSLNRDVLKQLATATHEANTLIDERTFSWTIFFNVIERTLPMNVRLVSVTPQIVKNELVIQMVVLSKSSDDFATFMENMVNADGAFYDVEPKAEEHTTDGLYRTTLQASYLAPALPGALARGTGKGGRP